MNAGNDQAACLGEVQGAGEVVDHRLTHDLAHLVVVVADEGVEHQRHVAVARMSVLPPRGTVDGELLGELLHALTQQVGEDPEAAGARPAKRLRVSRHGDPDRQLGLNGPGQGADLDLLLVGAGKAHRFPSPQAADDVDIAKHRVTAIGVVLRLQHEVVRLPAGSKGDPDAAAGEVVDDRPLLGDPDGVVQGRDAAPRAEADRSGDRRPARRW